MVVEEMNILTTVFLKFDNHKIYYPNSVLATKPIHNYYRSPDMGDAIDFCIHISTPVEKVTLMKERITRYCDIMHFSWWLISILKFRINFGWHYKCLVGLWDQANYNLELQAINSKLDFTFVLEYSSIYVHNGCFTCSYVDNKTEHWCTAPMIVMRDVVDMNRLKWSVWLTHKMNFQDMGERWVRRALLVEQMVKIFRELDIEYRLLPLDVNVRNMPPINSSRLPSNWTTNSWGRCSRWKIRWKYEDVEI